MPDNQTLDIPTGLIRHDTERATPGFTLFSPIRGGQAYLIDMAGEVVHDWKLKKGGIGLCHLLDNGNLFMFEQSGDGPPMPQGNAGLIREYDWAGNVVWEHLDHNGHHDARRLASGNTVYFAWEKLSAEEAARVQGGRPGTEEEEGGGFIWGDCLREVDASGKIVWEWRLKDQEIEDFPICPLCPRHEFAHANTCSPLPNGDILISFRVINTIMIVARETGAIKWQMRDADFGHQHDCQMLENGNILLFANGYHLHGLSISRILEINPESKETVWSYRGKPAASFFSPHISGCQRLTSGNTLICQGSVGRIFEVTPDGDMVWEYVSPYLVATPALGTGNFVFRAQRYAADSPQIQNRV